MALEDTLNELLEVLRSLSYSVGSIDSLRDLPRVLSEGLSAVPQDVPVVGEEDDDEKEDLKETLEDVLVKLRDLEGKIAYPEPFQEIEQILDESFLEVSDIAFAIVRHYYIINTGTHTVSEFSFWGRLVWFTLHWASQRSGEIEVYEGHVPLSTGYFLDVHYTINEGQKLPDPEEDEYVITVFEHEETNIKLTLFIDATDNFKLKIKVEPLSGETIYSGLYVVLGMVVFVRRPTAVENAVETIC